MNEVTIVSAGSAGSDIRLCLNGHIDSSNAEQVKDEIFSNISQDHSLPVIIDAENLEYISSAGLRILLQLRKAHPEVHIIDVRPEVYEIFDVTGFTQMLDISRAYKEISLDGAEIIGSGANGTVYRIDDDTVVKVFHDADSLDVIRNDREIARLALILGIPTAISYDIVKVGDKYGSVYELLNARSFAKILAEEPEKIDWCVNEYVDLLNTIHGTEVPAGKMPDMRKTAIGWAEFMKDYLPEESGAKLLSLVEAVPHDDHMIHGDYHTKNVVLSNGEVLLIDLDTVAVGDPVFEFASIFNAFVGFSEADPTVIEKFQGFDRNIAAVFWDKIFRAYIGTDDESVLKSMEDRARIVGYTRLIRRSIRRKGLEDEERKKEIDLWTSELIELLSRTDRLSFNAD